MRKEITIVFTFFCILFAALCLTACGDEGKENATPLPTNTAVQTETAKPTEVPTAVPTEVPTENPMPEKNYVPVKAKKISEEFCSLDKAETSGVDIDEALAYKIFQALFPTLSEKYIPYNGMWILDRTREYSESTELTLTKKFLFDYIDSGEYLTVVVYVYDDQLANSDLYARHIATFTYEGELINILWKYKQFDQFTAEKSMFFSYENKLYFTVVALEDSEPRSNGTHYIVAGADSENSSIYINPFWIYEIGKDKIDFIWDESIFAQYDEIFDFDLSEIKSIVYGFSDNNVLLYLATDAQENTTTNLAASFSFEKLLDDLNAGITTKDSAELSEKDLLESNMLKDVHTDVYYDGYIKSQDLWYNPRDNSKQRYSCKFYYFDDYILLISSPIPKDEVIDKSETSFSRILMYIATFTKDGKLIRELWHPLSVFGKGLDYRFFTRDNKFYIVTTTVSLSRPNSSFYDKDLHIVEFQKDRYEYVWMETMFLPNGGSSDPLKTCHNAYSWKINDKDGVDMYFYNENLEEFEYVKSFTFDELLSGVDITDW